MVCSFSQADGHRMLSTRSRDNQSFIGLLIKHEDFWTRPTACQADLTAKIFYDSGVCLSDVWGIAALLQAYYHCYNLDIPASSLVGGNIASCPGVRQNQVKLQLSVQPLPNPSRDTRENLSEAENRALVAECLITSVAVMMALSFLTATFAWVMIKERVTGFFYLQDLKGLPYLLNLVAMILLHVVIFSASTALALLPLVLNGSPLLLDVASLVETLVLYALATLPQVYTLQLCFADPLPGVLTLAIINCALGTLSFWPLYSQLGLALEWRSPDTLPEHWAYHLLTRLPAPSSSLADTLYHVCVHSHYCSHGPCSGSFHEWMLSHWGVMVLQGIVWIGFFCISQRGVRTML
ncbi:hypothetical protein ElyMa_003264000, partial [Elysia marginata]